MSLQINYNAGVYEIEGYLNTENCVYLKSQLETIIVHSSGVVICLNSVISIDIQAAKVVMSLLEKTQKNNKVFFIISKENEKVNDQFNALNFNPILM